MDDLYCQLYIQQLARVQKLGGLGFYNLQIELLKKNMLLRARNTVLVNKQAFNYGSKKNAFYSTALIILNVVM